MHRMEAEPPTGAVRRWVRRRLERREHARKEVQLANARACPEAEIWKLANEFEGAHVDHWINPSSRSRSQKSGQFLFFTASHRSAAHAQWRRRRPGQCCLCDRSKIRAAKDARWKPSAFLFGMPRIRELGSAAISSSKEAQQRENNEGSETRRRMDRICPGNEVLDPSRQAATISALA